MRPARWSQSTKVRCSGGGDGRGEEGRGTGAQPPAFTPSSPLPRRMEWQPRKLRGDTVPRALLCVNERMWSECMALHASPQQLRRYVGNPAIAPRRPRAPPGWAAHRTPLTTTHLLPGSRPALVRATDQGRTKQQQTEPSRGMKGRWRSPLIGAFLSAPTSRPESCPRPIAPRAPLLSNEPEPARAGSHSSPSLMNPSNPIFRLPLAL